MDKQATRFVIIGAGMSGILAGIKLKEAGHHNVTIYEKADRIGGTWRENTYPGLACDVPSHHYTYSFERNPDWTRHLPPGAEIQRYFEKVTDKYDVDALIEFNSEIISADFKEGRWYLSFKDGRTDAADVVIAATGVLHHPSTPSIPGMESFKGALFHSARWDHSVPLDGKRIGVIGMGSTGVQIISDLAARGIEVSHFVRNPQWIMPVENGHYSAEERAKFREDPAALEAAMDFENYRSGVERYTEALIDPGSEGSLEMKRICVENLNQNVKDPMLKEQLTPDHEPLCKRLIFSPDYYQAIQLPNSTLVRSDIAAIEEQGIRTQDGVLHELDVIVLATGFHADRFMRPMTITGRNGVDLESFWADRPKAYLSVTMPDFPNLFMLNGPNGPVGNFSLIDIAELQWDYIKQLIDKITAGECSEISPKQSALAQFDALRMEAAKQTIWFTGGCKSWYLDAQGVPASWPWNYSRFVEAMSAPKWEDFELA